MNITNELLAAYAEGNVSQEEREVVRQYLATNPKKMESVLFAMDSINNTDKYIKNLGIMLNKIDGTLQSPTISHQPSFLPMSAMAAQDAIDNLCVIKCESIALQHFGFDITEELLLKISKKEGWIQPKGTALHNIGRLSGMYGLSVSHRYHSTIKDIQEELLEGNVVIAVIDVNELSGDYAEEQKKDAELGLSPNHAIIVQSITDDNISIIDPATTPLTINQNRFIDAWNDSSNYMIVISNGNEYIPHPIKLDDIEIEDDLIELREAIAENAHEVWAEARKNEGWTYGPVRDDKKKQNPDLLPYNRLPESEKEYDRLMAMNTIKLVKKLGWELKKKK